MAAEMLEMRFKRDGYTREEWSGFVDPTDGAALREILVAAVRREGWPDPERILPHCVLIWRRQRGGGGWTRFTAAR
ncbi:hypothetical protein [Pseudonocardia asaccharolytica]|uniref:Uncharacterized protein n=1 Tax=Pseudonocardia asaccharolytica DSM 44247 = NBRC 16224 TaxID=1123024 RepID=A0A511D4D0_9PSEU|nr:hypothetical protein [Pseudonocardia asaccharolytica]GEL19333.1 hypothetical protein PA7_31700 [Pseudonocardia asaccharolytica DSM 44247 = NBRC 16224]